MPSKQIMNIVLACENGDRTNLTKSIDEALTDLAVNHIDAKKKEIAKNIFESTATPVVEEDEYDKLDKKVQEAIDMVIEELNISECISDLPELIHKAAKLKEASEVGVGNYFNSYWNVANRKNVSTKETGVVNDNSDQMNSEDEVKRIQFEQVITDVKTSLKSVKITEDVKEQLWEAYSKFNETNREKMATTMLSSAFGFHSVLNFCSNLEQ